MRLMALIPVAPVAMFSDLLSSGSSNARVPMAGDVSTGTASVAVHAVEDIFKRTAGSTIKRLKEWITRKTLKVQKREQVLVAKVTTVLAGTIVMVKEIILLMEGGAESSAKGRQITARDQAAGCRESDHKISLFRLIALGALLEADEDTASVGRYAYREAVSRWNHGDVAPLELK
jgi:hypothetical protein